MLISLGLTFYLTFYYIILTLFKKTFFLVVSNV